jgi:uncharacterized protein YgbK (DUF1537 family)
MFSTSPKTVIVADDLTGAADSAAPFVSGSLHSRALVVPWPGAARVAAVLDRVVGLNQPDVLSVDTATRNVASEEATARIAAVTSWIHRETRPDTFVKKIDSLLRGQIRAELSSLLDCLASYDRTLSIVMAPALPDQLRTTVRGNQLESGRPVHMGSAGFDPRSPVESGYLPSLLPPGWTPALLDLDAVRASALPEKLAQVARAGSAVIADAESNADLEAIASAVRGLPSLLVVGSSGLTRALAVQEGGAIPFDPPPRPPIVFVTASRHPSTRLQIQTLVAACPDLVTLEVDPDNTRLCDPDGYFEHHLKGRLHAALADGSDVLVTLSSTLSERFPKQTVDPRWSYCINKALAEAAWAAATAPVPATTLMLIGGDIASATLSHFEQDAFEPRSELDAGTVVCRLPAAETGPSPHLRLILRSGSFGAPEDLVKVKRNLSIAAERGGFHHA